MSSAVTDICKLAKEASRALALVSSSKKNKALLLMADAVEQQTDNILAANNEDMQAARAAGIGESLLDRLMLSPERIQGIAESLRQIAAQRDPVGEVVAGWKLGNGLQVRQVRVPIGVVGIIYEARPNVTVDAAGLALKAGNAAVLRGGSLAARSNHALSDAIAHAARQAGLPDGCIQSLAGLDRAEVGELLSEKRYVDLVVPRGGAQLIEAVVRNATMPVLWAGAGNCHIYAHQDAQKQMAVDIVINAKTQRPGVCNAAETLLIHSARLADMGKALCEALAAKGVEIRADERVREVFPAAKVATEEDWRTEFLDLIIAVKAVDSLEEAIYHINTYGSLHSEAIVTEDYAAARAFQAQVDAAAVYVNASTRFTDGSEFGMGAEIGISTQKLHARGPMGLTALTSVKYVIDGNGQIRG